MIDNASDLTGVHMAAVHGESTIKVLCAAIPRAEVSSHGASLAIGMESLLKGESRRPVIWVKRYEKQGSKFIPIPETLQGLILPATEDVKRALEGEDQMSLGQASKFNAFIMDNKRAEFFNGGIVPIAKNKSVEPALYFIGANALNQMNDSGKVAALFQAARELTDTSRSPSLAPSRS